MNYLVNYRAPRGLGEILELACGVRSKAGLGDWSQAPAGLSLTLLKGKRQPTPLRVSSLVSYIKSVSIPSEPGEINTLTREYETTLAFVSATLGLRI